MSAAKNKIHLTIIFFFSSKCWCWFCYLESLLTQGICPSDWLYCSPDRSSCWTDGWISCPEELSAEATPAVYVLGCHGCVSWLCRICYFLECVLLLTVSGELICVCVHLLVLILLIKWTNGKQDIQIRTYKRIK